MYIPNSVASLQKHKVAGHTYWRIVESRRVDGKPRPVPIMQLGTADALLDRLLHAPAGRLRLRSFRHGDVAALLAAAQRLDVVAIINRHVPKTRRALTVGQTLLLAALNRAIRPRSKRGFAAWAASTSLERLVPRLKVKALTSQYFWDQMDLVPLEALRAIEEDLTRRVVDELDVDLDTLFYDTTNYFTYISTTNPQSTLTRRGHSKQKRADLRLFGLALLVDRTKGLPLLSHVYEGNRVDSKVFPDALTRIRERLEKLEVDLTQLTVVYDKGNLSKKNQAEVDRAPFGYVASLTPHHHPNLMSIPLASYRRLGGKGRLADVRALRLEHEVWGAKRTVVLLLSEQLRAGQIRGLEQHLAKRLRELKAWKEKLAKPRSGPRSEEAARKQIEALCSGQYVKEVLRVTYDAKRKGADRLEYSIDQAAREHLETEVFGKRILMTDRSAWSTEDVILAYRGQSEVEAVFRQTKDEEHMAIRPQYHWTDQKIHVHTFICLLALLLGRVIEHEARKLGRTESLSGLLEELGSIRLAMVLRASGKKGGRPRAEWQLEEADGETLDLFQALVPDRRPFVYTPSAR